jgi:hypothetical protein
VYDAQVSSLPYDEELDEKMGSNKIVIASEDFSKVSSYYSYVCVCVDILYLSLFMYIHTHQNPTHTPTQNPTAGGP